MVGHSVLLPSCQGALTNDARNIRDRGFQGQLPTCCGHVDGQSRGRAAWFVDYLVVPHRCVPRVHPHAEPNDTAPKQHLTGIALEVRLRLLDPPTA